MRASTSGARIAHLEKHVEPAARDAADLHGARAAAAQAAGRGQRSVDGLLAWVQAVLFKACMQGKHTSRCFAPPAAQATCELSDKLLIPMN